MWLRDGLVGRSPKTIKKNENVLAPILTAIGGRRLRELTAGDVQHALAVMAETYSSAAVTMGHNALTRTIRHAESRDLVGRNVATLVASTPRRGRQAEQEPDPGAGAGAAGRYRGHEDARLHLPVPGYRDPHR